MIRPLRFLSVLAALLPFAALAQDDLRTPRPAQLPDLGMEVHHDIPDAGPPVDAGVSLLPDGGLPPRPAPDQAAILKAIGDHQAGITSCVEAEHRKHPSWLATKVTAGFTITPQGKVTHAQLGDRRLNSGALGKCVRAALEKLSFQAFDGDPVSVEIPLVLRDRGSGEPHESAGGGS